MHVAAFASTTNGDIHGRGDRRSEMKVVHESGAMSISTSPKTLGDDDEPLRELQELRTGNAATARVHDRMKLFLILFYDLCRYLFIVCINIGRVLFQRLIKTFDDRA